MKAPRTPEQRRSHRERERINRPKRRALRRQLGFCLDCTKRAATGFVRCPGCQTLHAIRLGRWRERQRQARGWKMVRVPVGGIIEQ